MTRGLKMSRANVGFMRSRPMRWIVLVVFYLMLSIAATKSYDIMVGLYFLNDPAAAGEVISPGHMQKFEEFRNWSEDYTGKPASLDAAVGTHVIKDSMFMLVFGWLILVVYVYQVYRNSKEHGNWLSGLAHNVLMSVALTGFWFALLSMAALTLLLFLPLMFRIFIALLDVISRFNS